MIGLALMLTAGLAPGANVQVFVLEDCPIARKYAPEIKRIAADYAPRGVTMSIVHVDPHTTKATAEAFAKEFGYSIPYVLDPEHKLANKAKVTNVPSVAVFVKGSLAYTGRIDDRFPALGVQRPAPTKRDLRIALDEILAGKKVTTPKTKAVGCAMPTL